MRAPLPGTLLVTQLFGGGTRLGESYTAWHDGANYKVIGHPAIDWNCATGTPVLAMKGGIVAYPQDSYSPFLGLYAVVTLPNGEAHWYAHLSDRVAGQGDRVNDGQQIARSGASGNVTGPHLHCAVRPNGPNYANGYEGFVDYLTHFDSSVYPRIDLSLV